MKDKPITPQLRAFLTELADLLEKHEVTINAVEDSRGYSVSTDGIEFDQPSKFDAETNHYVREHSWVELRIGTSTLDGEWLRKLTSELPEKP